MLHMLKLCVGVTEIAHLARFQHERLARTGGNAHITRMTPRRAAEILDGGSLYWIMAGMITVRQRILGIEPFVAADGVRRCRIELDPQLVMVAPRPHRPFQGWRYFKPQDAPPDLDAGSQAAEMPDSMRRALGDLGLL